MVTHWAENRFWDNVLSCFTLPAPLLGPPQSAFSSSLPASALSCLECSQQKTTETPGQLANS